MALMDRNLKSSTNYIWNTSAVLGKGATSSVYQGLSKHTGEVVAVKSFNPQSQLRPDLVRRREFEVLRKVNHENIVKLLAIEEETEKQDKVLVMELCTGGSLFNILDDPANSFGLEESEFLLVLKNLTAGMKHLRDMNIIHRDLKPGNIMKFLYEDGRAVYKLTDFGAARELDEDQQFVSLYGTEEYLHPEVYARAVLRHQTAKPFSAKVDLWSIGVTLYHIATGSLPFRPYGGRKNKEMMHKITTEKQQGIISGIQHSDNGDIEWHNTLPKTCLLSPSLQEKIIPLLAGLLEYNPNNMWTFDQFFQAVTHVLSHKPVHVFCVSNICDYTFYLQPNEKIAQLKARLSNMDTAQIPETNQLMIWGKRELLDDENVISTSQDNPIILINSEATSIKAGNPISSNQFKIPDILSSVGNTYEQDAQQSKACASIAYCIHRNSTKCLLYCNIISQVPHQIMSLIENNVKLLNEKRESCSHLIESLEDKIEYTSTTALYLSKCLNRTELSPTNLSGSDNGNIRLAFFEKLQKTWKELLPKMIDISKRVDTLNENWSLGPKHIHDRLSASRATADYLCTRIKESWLFLHKNRTSRSYIVSENQLHHLEKLRIDANCKKLLRLHHEDIDQAMVQLVEKLDDWYNDAHVALVQSDCLLDELARLIKNRNQLLEQLDKMVEGQHHRWQQLLNHIANLSKLEQSSVNDSSSGGNNTKGATDNKPPNLRNKLDLSNAFTDHVPTLQDSFAALDCGHDQSNLVEEIQSLQDTQRALRACLGENKNLLSEFASITISSKNSAVNFL